MFTHLSRMVGSLRLRLLAGAACVVISGAAGVLIAGDPLPAPVSSPPAATKPVAISDVALARAVLAAIDADPVLKDVNILVSVVDRGAVIGGPVASEMVKKRAEAVVRGVSGIESVKNTCFVAAEPDPLLRAVAERLKPDAKPTGSPALPGVALTPTSPAGFLPPVPPQPPSDLLASATGPNTVVAQKPPLSAAPVVGVLGAPVSPASPTTATTAPGALTGSTKPADVQAGAATLRKADARFARLTVELKPDGAVFVSGWSAKAADAWDFAAQLGKLPGVARVVVDPRLVK